MPTYRITNRVTCETYEVDAPSDQNAVERLGWLIDNCYVFVWRDTPYTDLTKQPQRIVDDYEECTTICDRCGSEIDLAEANYAGPELPQETQP